MAISVSSLLAACLLDSVPLFPLLAALQPDESATVYSAIAQASATIVAIIGGFVVATVLQIAAQREGVRSAVGDLERRRGLAMSERQDARRELVAAEVEYAVWRQSKTVMSWATDMPSLSEVKSQLALDHLSDEEVQPERHQLQADLTNAVELVKEYEVSWSSFVQRKMHIPMFGEWTRVRKPRLSGRLVWFAEEMQEMKAAEARRKNSNDWAHIGLGLPPIDDSNWVIHQSEGYQNRIREADDALQHLDSQIAYLESDLTSQRLALARVLAAPPHLLFGFITLVVLTVGGVVLPVFFMAQGASEYRFAKILTTSLISALGVVLVALYVGILLGAKIPFNSHEP